MFFARFSPLGSTTNPCWDPPWVALLVHEQWRYVAFDLVNQGGEWVHPCVSRWVETFGECWFSQHLQHSESSYLQGTFKIFPYCQTVKCGELFLDAFPYKVGQISMDISPTWNRDLRWELPETNSSQPGSTSLKGNFIIFWVSLVASLRIEGPCWNEWPHRSLYTNIYSWLHSFTRNGEKTLLSKGAFISTSDSFFYCRVLHIERKTHLRSCFFLPLHLFFLSPPNSRLHSTAKDSK